MTRNFSNMCFGLAIGCSLLLRSFAVQEDLVWLAVLSVILTATLIQWMPVRSMGIAGISGLFVVYTRLQGNSLPGHTLILLASMLLAVGVYLAITADLPERLTLPQGDGDNHEV